MKEVKCKCGKGIGLLRHDSHILHKLQPLKCKDCLNSQTQGENYGSSINY